MHSKMAELILENGMRFKGRAFGYVQDVVGEIIFSTSMTGYQEMLTDPTLCGQIVVDTYPLVGNYGINLEDMESDKLSLTALVVREKCDYPNNFRTEMDLDGFLRQNRVVGLEGIDTRALTRVIRDRGCMRAIITTEVGMLSDRALEERFAGFDNSDAVSQVSVRESYTIPGSEAHIALLDLGVKNSILRALKSKNCKVTVFPYNTSAEKILAAKPEALLVSNGPGSPEDIPETVETVKELIGKLPLRGICLGQLVIGMALGATVKKLKFGHHGANQPVKSLIDGTLLVTAQSHNYVLDDIGDRARISHINVNDGTCEGIVSEELNIKCIQFRPEDYPSSHISGSIFDDFLV